jgi:hypothetical protein
MNDPYVTHETKNDPVLFQHDQRRDERNESTKGVLKNESSKK